MEIEIEVTIIQLRNNRHPVLGMSFRDEKTSERLSNFPKDKPLARNRADWKLSTLWTSGLGSLKNYLQWDRWRGKVGGTQLSAQGGKRPMGLAQCLKQSRYWIGYFLKKWKKGKQNSEKRWDHSGRIIFSRHTSKWYLVIKGNFRPCAESSDGSASDFLRNFRFSVWPELSRLQTLVNRAET